MNTESKTSWHYSKGSSPHFQGQIYDENTGRTIAVTYHDEDGSRTQLMAAAPMLAEALQSIMEWTDTPSEQIPIERRELLVRNAARAALAAAGLAL